MIFVSYWAGFNSHHADKFFSNTEVPFDEVRGIDDIRNIEKYIMDKLNGNRTPLIASITIITWKRFNT